MSSGKIEHYSVFNCSVHVFTICRTPKFILNAGSVESEESVPLSFQS